MVSRGEIAPMDTAHFSAAHTLKNGTAITIRAIRHDDKPKLLEAFKHLDKSSIYTRFFGYKKQLTDAELEQATNIDFEATVALVATTGNADTETVIGGGRYIVLPGLPHPQSAEVAFTIEEDYQGLGIASLILKQLVEIARAKGLKRFDADVLKGNAAMISVFRRSGLAMRQRPEGGVVHVTLELGPPGS